MGNIKNIVIYNDGSMWRIVHPELARSIFAAELFELYQINSSDQSEGLIEYSDSLEELISHNCEIAIELSNLLEVGLANVDYINNIQEITVQVVQHLSYTGTLTRGEALEVGLAWAYEYTNKYLGHIYTDSEPYHDYVDAFIAAKCQACDFPAPSATPSYSPTYMTSLQVMTYEAADRIAEFYDGGVGDAYDTLTFWTTEFMSHMAQNPTLDRAHERQVFVDRKVAELAKEFATTKGDSMPDIHFSPDSTVWFMSSNAATYSTVQAIHITNKSSDSVRYDLYNGSLSFAQSRLFRSKSALLASL